MYLVETPTSARVIRLRVPQLTKIVTLRGRGRSGQEGLGGQTPWPLSGTARPAPPLSWARGQVERKLPPHRIQTLTLTSPLPSRA